MQRFKPTRVGRRDSIHDVAKRGDAVRLRSLLQAQPELLHESGWNDSRPLHSAVEANHIECVSALLELGANVNHADFNGETPLFWAKSREVLDLLVNAGADTSIVSHRGQNAFEYGAAYHPNIDVLRFWLDIGVDVNNVPDFGPPALHGISGFFGRDPVSDEEYERRITIIQLLCARGAAIDLRDNSGATALLEACRRNHEPLAAALIEAGTDLNAQDARGHTALHAAVKVGSSELCRSLLEAGADPNQCDLHRQTPFDACAPGSELHALLAPHHRPEKLPPPPSREAVLERLFRIPGFQNLELRGHSPSEVDDFERSRNQPLPAAYRSFLETLGKDSGAFLRSDHWYFAIDEVTSMQDEAEYLLYSNLPEEHFVFACRNGYVWLYFVADGTDDDPPVYMINDGPDRTPKLFARTIWEFVHAQVVDCEIFARLKPKKGR